MEKHIVLKEKVVSAYMPSVLTISTNSTYELCKLNNLTPAELLRPFGEVVGGELRFDDQNVIRLRKFNFHFVDTDHLQSKKSEEFVDELKKILHFYSPSFPFPDIAVMTTNSCLEMKDRAVWTSKFVKAFKELSNFMMNEFLSSPISILYIFTTKDNIVEEVKQIENVSYIKVLLAEKIINPIHSFYLLLNDGKGAPIKEQLDKLRAFTKTMNVGSLKINSEVVSKPLPDIWAPYIQESILIRCGDIKRGQLISASERESMKEYLSTTLKNEILYKVQEHIKNKKKNLEARFSFWVYACYTEQHNQQ
jgi:hypothetical protein